MIKKLLVFLCYFVLIHSSFAVSFTEIFYDPIGADDDHEWFELFNDKNETTDMTGWKFFEAETNHNLVAAQGDYFVESLEYFVVAENPTQFLIDNPTYSGTLFDSTFSLSNTGETLVMKDKNGTVFDNITYNYLSGGSETGFSLGLHDNNWKQTLMTPGSQNKVTDICDWKVSIKSDELIFDSPQQFAWKVAIEKILGEPSDVTIKRTIFDVNEIPVREYNILTHSINTRETLSHDPNLKPGTYLIATEIIPSCKDSVSENNRHEVLLAIKESPKSKESSVKIERLYDLGKDETATFGQLIRANVVAYRGDTTKETISVWIEGKEKVSKVLTFKIEEKFTQQAITLPLQIFPNCDGKLTNGDYKVVIEGFTDTDEMKLSIDGIDDDVCKLPKNATRKTTSESAISEKKSIQASEPSETIDVVPSIKPTPLSQNSRPFLVSTIMFESTQRKAERIVPMSFAFILSLAVIVLLFHKQTP